MSTEIALEELAKILLAPQRIVDYQHRLEAIAALASEHCVYPQVYDAVMTYVSDDTIRKKFWLHGIQIKQKAQQIQAEVQALQSRLEQVAIPVLWLKGVALASQVYPHFWLRSMSDVDLLIPFQERETALDLLLQANYQLSSAQLPSKLIHHYRLISESGLTVEIHYEAVSKQFHYLPCVNDWFWEHSCLDAQTGYRFLKPEALLIHLAVHDVLQHEHFSAEISTSQARDGVQLRRKWDMYLVMQQYLLDWEWILREATSLKWDKAVQKALEDVAYYFDIALPQQFLRDASPNGFKMQQQERHLLHYWQVWKNAKFSEKVFLTRLYLFPTQEQMRKQYGLENNASLWQHYLRRTIEKGVMLSRLLGRWLWQKWQVP